ncbi:MAG: YkgJ family cysteine cluster protein [Terracidiphilus sp.]|nr:YkgJ family cysteine cluster protein [Terracidiphilus sp.]
MLPAGDAELVQIVDAALADAAQRAGQWLACRAGCTQCCYGAFAIGALDAERLRATMLALQAENPSLANAIRQRAEAWIARHAATFPGDALTGVLGVSEADQAAFDDFANDAPCPALDPDSGHCGVYVGRPMTCRVFGPPVRNEGGALGHCELCFQGAPTATVAACEMHLPHELEARLLEELGDARETVVAYALVR